MVLKEKLVLFAFVLCSAALCPALPAGAWDGSALVVDHTCTDISRIPPAWVDSTKTAVKWHFAHTSHGGQISEGMNQIEIGEPFLSVIFQYLALPVDTGSLCTMDGQFSTAGVSPDWYWETETGMNETRTVLEAVGEINMSMFVWCTQLDYYTAEQVGAYLDSLKTLEEEHPRVIFIYCTGNAQNTGAAGYNRWLRNEQIRNWCRANNKVLYDFADLDSWWLNPDTGQWEQATYEYEGSAVPVEHPRFHGEEVAHTTMESCIQKGRAMWWLSAGLTGWNGVSTAVRPTSLGGMKSLFRR